MAEQVSSLIVRLIDQVTGPAKSIAAAIRGIGAASKQGGGVRFADRLDAAIARNNARLSTYRGQMVDAIATLYTLKRALTAPIESAMEMQTALTEIGNKSGMTAEQLKKLGSDATGIGKRTNQFTSEILKGADILIGFGLDAQAAAGSLEAIGKTSTATGASIEDLSKLGFAAISNLNVPVDQLAASFDVLDKAGKMGGFELRDMARYFPTLGAAAQAMGQNGVAAVTDLGAALQIVRRGTGNSEEAATALANLYQKMRAPLTAKNFKKYGINIRKEINKGVKAGKSPVEVMIEQANKAIKKGAILEDLFADKQVQEAMRPLIKNFEDYLKLRSEAANAAGTVDADFANKMETNAERMKAFNIAMSNLSTSIGNALLPSLTSIVKFLTPIVDKFGEWAEKHPKLAAAIVGSVAGFFALGAALSVIKYASALGFGGILTLAKNVQVLAGAMGMKGISGLGLLGFGVGLGAVAAALGTWAYINWDELTAGWSSFWATLNLSDEDSAKLDDLAKRLNTISGIDMSGILKMKEGSGAQWGKFFGEQANQLGSEMLKTFETDMRDIERIMALWDKISNFSVTEFGDKVSASARGAMDAMRGWLDENLAIVQAKVEGWQAAGVKLGTALKDGAIQAFNDFLAWCASLPSKIIAAIGQIDLSSILKWPSLPTWLGGSGGASEAAPAVQGPPAPGRARGGPVSRGRAYIVGERRPELFTPSSNGYISQARAGGGGGATIAPTFNLTFNGSVDQSTVEKIKSVLREEVRQAFRGVYADAGMRFA